jgi:hypothetical protein
VFHVERRRVPQVVESPAGAAGDEPQLTRAVKALVLVRFRVPASERLGTFLQLFGSQS